ncbi:MAG TPA: hypothetical protein PLE99_01910 [Candidatus Thiothrix moscowensis]|nr:hypothetical protein [Thiothrix sp. UBA5583]HRJ51494.1 hypothetical protein [Candidatus Thiothrix moscowensis]
MTTIQTSKQGEPVPAHSDLNERELYRRGRRGDASVSDHPFGKAGYRYYQIEQAQRLSHTQAGEYQPR